MKRVRSETCPITGLKVIKSSEWENIEFSSGYKVSSKIIGDRIIYGKGEGKPTIEGLVSALGLAQKIIDEFFNGKPFIFIEDFEKIINPSFEARKYYINFMTNLKNMKALIYLNVNPYMKFNIRLAKKLNILSYPVFVVKNYKEAIQLAVKVLSGEIPTKKEKKIEIIERIHKPEWDINSKDAKIRFEVINKKILHSIPKGEITPEILNKSFKVSNKIRREYFSIIRGEYYIVVDFSKISTTSPARKIFIKEINEIYERNPFKAYILYNVSKPISVIISLSRPLLKFSLKTVRNFEAALEYIYRKENPIKKLLDFSKFKEKLSLFFRKKTDPTIQKYVDEFLEFLSEIDWEEVGMDEKYKKPPSHPLYQIYEAVAVIKNDLDELYLQKQKNEEEKALLEHRLHQSLKLEAIGKLAGTVAHDLNNVLMGIVSYPDYLLKIIPDSEENKKARKYIRKMKESGIRAANIVEDLLTLSGKGVKSLKILNLNSILEEFITTPEFKELSEKYPNIRVKISKDENLYNLKGSKIHLYKTILNLVKNAFEAIENEGEVIISTKNVKFNNKKLKDYENVPDGEYIELIVSDNGSGISEKDLQKIFEPFFSKKRVGTSGTGLGMMVVKNTVEDHGGFIEVESKVRKGTTFSLYFPAGKHIDEKNSKYEKSQRIDDYTGKGESILIVDDEEEQRIIASDILKSLYYKVKTASSGEEAVKMIKKESFDLVLLDMIMLHGMDGLETYKKIKEINPKQKTIIISGYSRPNQVLEAQRLGVKKYIRKPYTIEAISKAVFELLNEK